MIKWLGEAISKMAALKTLLLANPRSNVSTRFTMVEEGAAWGGGVGLWVTPQGESFNTEGCRVPKPRSLSLLGV